MASVGEAQSTAEKLAGVRKAILLRNALLEGPSLLAIILFMLTGSIFYLGIAGAMIIWFALQYPTRSKVISAAGPNDLPLSDRLANDRF